MVAGYGNGIEAGHVGRGVSNNIGHDPHGRCGRIDISIANHEFLQDVVLQRAGQFLLRYTLFFGGNDKHRHDRQCRTIHSHRDRNLVERDTVEQNFHIGDAVDGHAGLAHITDDTRVVRVVAAMSGEIEGYRETRLPRLQVLSIEGVGFFCGGKTRVLTYSPWAASIHRRPGPTDKGRQAGQRIEVRESFEIFGRVQRLDRDALGRIPGQFFGRLAFAFFAGERSPIVE